MPSFLGLPSPPKEIIPAPPAFPCQESGCTSTFSSMTQLQYHHNSVHERPRPPRKKMILFGTYYVLFITNFRLLVFGILVSLSV